MPALPQPSNRGRRTMKYFRMMGLGLAAAFCAGQASAQELTGTLKNIKETGAITLGHRDSSIPFSYLDDNQKPIGFAMDICYKIVDAVKKELKLDKLDVRHHQHQAADRSQRRPQPRRQHHPCEGSRRGVPDGRDRSRGGVRDGRYPACEPGCRIE